MEELCVEGLATHDDPEPCVDDPRGRGEALVGARAGRDIEPRNPRFGVPTLYKRRKAIPLAAFSRAVGGPAWSENQGMYGTSGRENREIPCSPTRLITGWAAQGTLRR